MPNVLPIITIWRPSDCESISFPGQQLLFTVDTFPLLVVPVFSTRVPDLWFRHDNTKWDPLILILQKRWKRQIQGRCQGPFLATRLLTCHGEKVDEPFSILERASR